MIGIAHLYTLNTCGHNCPLCCNRLYDINKLPCITNEILSQVHTVCLTGGDPFYLGDLLLGNLVASMRKQCHKYIDPHTLTSINMQIMGRNWQEEFNTPDNEGFYRLPILLD